MGTFDPGLTLWTLITFGMLFLVLARFTFRPLTRILKEREAAIRRSLDDAEKARRSAQELLAQTQAQLEKAREEARKILDEGQHAATDMRREALQNARREASELLDQARTDIDRELRRGLDDLKETVADLAIKVSREAIRHDISESLHHQLTEDFISELSQHAPSGKN